MDQQIGLQNRAEQILVIVMKTRVSPGSRKPRPKAGKIAKPASATPVSAVTTTAEALILLIVNMRSK